MTEPMETEWLEQIQRNGMMIAAAIDQAKSAMPPEDDAGNALAFAVAMSIEPDDIDDFVDSLRTFSDGRDVFKDGRGI